MPISLPPVLRTPKARTYWLDVLRVAGTLAVICIHVSGTPAGDRALALGTSSWWARSTALAATRWCVPVFVMISGALLLPNPHREGATDFYRRRLSRMLIPILFWTGVYFGLRIASGERLGPAGIVFQIVYGTTYYHFWFLYMILGLYLVTPFLRVFVEAATRPLLAWSVAVALGLAGLEYFHSAFTSTVPWPIIAFSWIPYTGYFLAGYWRSTGESRPGRARLALLVAIAASLGAVLFTRFAATRPGPAWLFYSHTYFNIPVILASLAMFTWARDRAWDATSPPRGIHRAIVAVAPATFGIYIVHPLFILWLRPLGVHPYAPALISPWLGIPILTALVFVLSAATTLLLQRIPIARAIVP